MPALLTSRARSLLALTVLAAAALAPGRARGEGEAAASTPAPEAAPSASASPVSATGLLPIFGVAVDFDALPSGKGTKPEDAVEAIKGLWDQYLKGAGFNVVQFPVDVRELEDKGAGRLAKLCRWAQQNNVRLAPILTGSAIGEPLPDDFPEKAGAFAAKTIELVGKEGDPQAYAQIMMYQIERPLNHPANHGPLEPANAAERIRATIEKLRAAEQTALAGTSLQATPALASASFDYELIRFGAIAHVPITDEAYQQAYESLRGYLAAVASSAPVDVVGLEWFPGSLSADAVDRLPDAIQKLQADLPGKLLVVGTGYSTAAGGEPDQTRYYTQAFNNLSDLRTNQGVESSLAGILWRTALDRSAADPTPPSDKTVEEMAKWNWPERAAEVTRMWNEPGADSKEMRWWLGRIENHFGLLATAKDGSKPKASYQLLSKLKTSLAAAAEATGAGDIAKELTGQGSGKGVAGAVKDRLQAALFGMLDAWIAKTAQNMVSGGSDDGGGAPPPPPTPAAMADLQIVGIGELAAAPKVNVLTPLSVTVFNAGSAPATNLVLYLREGVSTDLAFSSPTTLSPGGSTTVELPWTPAHPGNFHDVALDAYCDNEGDPSTNHATLGDIPVEPGATPPKPGKGGFAAGSLSLASLGLIKGAIVTRTDPGFVRIETIRSITPVMMKMSAPAPGGAHGGSAARSAMSGGGLPGGGVSRSGSSALQPVALAFSISNPFDHNFTQVKATLKVENKVAATKDLGTLSPRQRRTVTFSQWTPPKAGTYAVKIDLSGLGPNGHALTSTATDQITVGGPSGATRPMMAYKSGPGGGPAAGSAAGSSSPTQTRLVMPILTASTGTQSGGLKARPLYQTLASSKPAAAASLFGLTANSLLLQPFPTTAGQEVELSVRLFHSDRLPAKKVKVEAFVGLDKMGEVTVDVPVARAVLARGFKKWTAKPGRHNVRAVVTFAGRTSTATKPIDIRPPHGVGAGGVALLLGRSASALPKLAIASSDIRTNPVSPMAGNSVELSVRVQNVGPVDAKGVRAEVYANGVRLGEAIGDVAAGKDAILTGFPAWTPVAGKFTLLCRTTVGLQREEASRDIVVGVLSATLVKPLIAATTLTRTTRPDLEILPGDITFSPAAPKPGSELTISIAVRNMGSAAAAGGTVLGTFLVDGQESARRLFTAAVGARGTTILTWKVTTPGGKQLTVGAKATVTNDSRLDNNEARAYTAIQTITLQTRQELVYPTR